mgnify:CR=1 FL=1
MGLRHLNPRTILHFCVTFVTSLPASVFRSPLAKTILIEKFYEIRVSPEETKVR